MYEWQVHQFAKTDMNPTHNPGGDGLLRFDGAKGYLEEKWVKKREREDGG